MRNRPKRLPRTTWLLLGLLLVVVALAVSPPVARLCQQRGDTGNHHHGGGEAAVSEVAEQLRRMSPAERVPLLLQHLDADSPGLRYAAVDALGNERVPLASEALERAFADSSSVVRQRALEVLPNVDAERGIRLLLAGLRDEDLWMRHAAATQLALRASRKPTVVDRHAVPLLVQALSDPDPVVRTMAQGALRTLTGNRWHAPQSAPEAEKQAVIGKWRRWWREAHKTWPAVPPEFADPVPIRPVRMDLAPNVSLTDIEGRPVSLAGQRGRITLLNFGERGARPVRQRSLPWSR